MPNQRGPGQKLVPVPMHEKFIAEIQTALPLLGYSDRSSFIRTAILEKLKKGGYHVDPMLSRPPSRLGKGGRRKVDPEAPAAEAPPATVIEHKPTRGRGKAASFGSSAVAEATKALAKPAAKPAEAKAAKAAPAAPARAAAKAPKSRSVTPVPAAK